MHTYKKALVVGCGRSGRAAEALLRSEGCTVVSICQETTPNYRYEDIHFDPDIAIISPGFSLEHPWVAELVQRDITILSELELGDRKSTRLNSSHSDRSRMPSSA